MSYIYIFFFSSPCPVFPENKPFEAAADKLASTTNPWDKAKSNEVAVTFTLTSAAAKVTELNPLPSLYTPFLNPYHFHFNPSPI